MKKLFATLVLVLLCPMLSPGWGFFGHKVITQIAVYSLPDGMQGFYFRNLNRLVQLSTAADQRREIDSLEAGRHFINMDHFGDDPFNTVPKAWDKASAKYSADTLRKYGTVPWVVLDLQKKLTQAFRTGDTTAILNLSADLGHYVADAYVPLHTTLNYDGQLSNQQGLHALWESKLPERHVGEYKLMTKSARYLKDPQQAIWEVLQQSYGFLGATFDLEEKASRGFTPEQKYSFSHRFGKTRRAYSDAFADVYHKHVGGMVMFRMQLAPTTVASMWLTAWQDAGKPNLEKLLKKPISKQEKEKLDEQLTAWKKNQLVPNTMLLAQVKEKPVQAPDQIKAAADMAPPPAEVAPPVAAPVAAPAGSTPPPAPEKVKVKTKTPAGTNKQKAKKAAPANDGWN